MTTQHHQSALHALQRCGTHIRFAHAEAAELVAPLLGGSRAQRATELAEKLAECLSWAERLSVVVTGDLRADA